MATDSLLGNSLKKHTISELDALFLSSSYENQKKILTEYSYIRSEESLSIVKKYIKDGIHKSHPELLEIENLINDGIYLFGSGKRLRCEIPDTEIDDSNIPYTKIVGLWFLGFFITINALLIKEHTNYKTSPIVFIFILMLFLFFISWKMTQRSNRSFLIIDPDLKTIIIETLSKTNILSASYSIVDCKTEIKKQNGIFIITLLLSNELVTSEFVNNEKQDPTQANIDENAKKEVVIYRGKEELLANNFFKMFNYYVEYYRW